jgi:nicotinamide-nucleotide amidase
MSDRQAMDQVMDQVPDQNLDHLAAELLAVCAKHGLSVIAAESCTAGFLCRILADAPNAATYFHGGFVTYTKEHKQNALDVSGELLRRKGAVCGEVACAMADGALLHSTADLAVGITGVAGPEPDEDGNPVGLVCIAILRRGCPARVDQHDYGDIGRASIRRRAAADALRGLIAAAQRPPT